MHLLRRLIRQRLGPLKNNDQLQTHPQLQLRQEDKVFSTRTLFILEDRRIITLNGKINLLCRHI